MAEDFSLCDQCKSTGLAILPVRYTVVPKVMGIGLPSWAGGDRVKSVALDEEFVYALRTSRMGFIYLFYAKNARGKDQWECYSVAADGTLVLQPSPKAAQSTGSQDLACANPGHAEGAMRHCLVIDQPEKCGATWIAFSQSKWSESTVHAYQTNSEMREARMQTIYPSKMITGSKHSHGAIATKESLEQVFEYAAAANTTILPWGQEVGDISEGPSGAFRANRLEWVSTRYPWHMRSKQAQSTAAHLCRRSKRLDGKPGTPHVLALWDAIGITHELNGYRNDAAGWIAKYGKERELQTSAANCIFGIKRGLADQVNQRIDFADSVRPTQSAEEVHIADLLQRNPRDPNLNRRMRELKNESRQREIKRAEDADRMRRQHFAHAWPKYQSLLDMQALAVFEKNFAELSAAAKTIIDRRTVSLVHWLETPLFIDTLDDFHQQSMPDGILFEDLVGDLVFGMNSSPAGQQKIDEWVTQAKASVKGNLLWRAIAMNQNEGIEEVDAALAHIYSNERGLAKDVWNKISNEIKWSKLTDLVKKSLGLHNAQSRAAHDPNSKVAPLQTTRGLDKIFLSTGNAFFKPFAQTLDSVNHAMLFLLLGVRAGAEEVKLRSVITWDIWESRESREELIRRLKNQGFYRRLVLDDAVKNRFAARNSVWGNLRNTADEADPHNKSFNAVRDQRLSLVIAAFEAFNLAKAIVQAGAEPGNERVQEQLRVAMCATASATIDWISTFVRTLGGESSSFASLKVLGGTFSILATSFGAVSDVGKAWKRFVTADYRLAVIYTIRSYFQQVAAVLTALTAFSYCSPLIETFEGKFGKRIFGQTLSKAAHHLLLRRIALFLGSLQVAIFLFVVGEIICYFEDTETQIMVQAMCIFRHLHQRQ